MWELQENLVNNPDLFNDISPRVPSNEYPPYREINQRLSIWEFYT